jgi:hypothetical protein
MGAVLQYGSRLVRQLLGLLSSSRIAASLVSNVTETLYCLLIAAEEAGTTAQCAAWFEEVIFSAEFFAPLTELEHRQLLHRLLFSYSSARSRLFKALVQDLYKICAKELTVDTLMAYN